MIPRVLRLWLVVVVTVSCSGLNGCASDPKMLRWESALQRVGRLDLAGKYEDAIRGYHRLARRSLNPVDRQLMRLAAAKSAIKAGRLAEGVMGLGKLGRTALRRADRARAFYEIAKYAEARGRLAFALSLYRRLVLTYPELMPGIASLLHLQRIAKTSEVFMWTHLRWTHQHFSRLAHTSLGDNLIYFAATRAVRRFRATPSPQNAALALRLYRRVVREYPRGSHWDDALWAMSYIYHQLGHYRKEIAAIERILARRQKAALIGSYDHPFYWKGALRIARVQALRLKRLDRAVATYDWFIREYPRSRWLDDVFFWRGCVLLQLGERVRAETSFRQIGRAYRYSKYLRRLDQARAAPYGAVCEPKPFLEDG